jgi:hypothetical protein
VPKVDKAILGAKQTLTMRVSHEQRSVVPLARCRGGAKGVSPLSR